MNGKLTDKERKKIIADYIETNNYCETGRLNNVPESTVRSVIKADKSIDIVKMCEQKKEENTQDILEYMDSITEKQKRIINLSLEVIEQKLSNPDKYINLKDLATVYGVIFDKALKYKEIKVRETGGSVEGLDKVQELLSKIKDEADDNK